MEKIQLFVSVPKAAALLDTSRQNVYLIQKQDPTFPRVVKLGARKSGIFWPDLKAWAEAKARKGGVA